MNLPHNDSPRIRQSCIILGLVLIGLLRAIGPELGKYKQCCFNNHLITLVKLRPSSSDVVKLMFLSVKLEKSSLLYIAVTKKYICEHFDIVHSFGLSFYKIHTR